MTYQEALAFGTKELEESDADAKLDARLLLEAVCGTNLNTLLLTPERAVTGKEEERYRAYLSRRKAHEPTAYILGHAGFMGLDFIVSHDTLIPEQDSEVLIETLLSMCEGRKNLKVLDLCTGSGCLLLSFLKLQGAGATGLGTDLSKKALAIAEKNRKALGLEEQSRFLLSDLFEELDKMEEKPVFDLILSNPPYIRSGEIERLPEEVKSGEPHMALDGGEDGLSFYRAIAPKAREYLAPGGILAFEIGYDEREDVEDLMQDAGYGKINSVKDYGGNDRVVTGVLPL